MKGVIHFRNRASLIGRDEGHVFLHLKQSTHRQKSPGKDTQEQTNVRTEKEKSCCTIFIAKSKLSYHNQGIISHAIGYQVGNQKAYW